MKLKYIFLTFISSCFSIMDNNLAMMIGVNLNKFKIKFGANNSFAKKNINAIFEIEYNYNNLLASISFMPFKKKKLYEFHIKNIFKYFSLGIYHEINNYKKIEVGVRKKITTNKQNDSPINLKFIIGIKLTQKNFNPYIAIELNLSSQLSDQETMFFEVKGQSDFIYNNQKSIKQTKNNEITHKNTNKPLNSINQPRVEEVLSSTINEHESLGTNQINQPSIVTNLHKNLDTHQSSTRIPAESLIPNQNNPSDVRITPNESLIALHSDNDQTLPPTTIVEIPLITNEDIKNFSCTCSLWSSKEQCTLNSLKKNQEELLNISSVLSSNKIEDFEGYKSTELLEINDFNNLIKILKKENQNDELEIFNCIAFDGCDDIHENLIERYPIIKDIEEYLVINKNKEIFIPILTSEHYISLYIYMKNNELKIIKLDPISIQEDITSCGFVVLYFAKLASKRVLKNLCEHKNLLQNIKEIAIQECGTNILKYLSESEKFQYLKEIYEEYSDFFDSKSDLQDIITNIKRKKCGSIIRKIILNYYLTFNNSYSN